MSTTLLDRTPTEPEPELESTPRKKPLLSFRGVCWIVAAIVVFLILYPLVRTTLGMLGIGTDAAQLGQMWATFWQRSTLTMTVNTVLAVGIAGIGALAAGALFAWANERTDARLGFAARSLPLIPMFIPSIAAAVGWVFLASSNAGLLNVLIRNVLGTVGIEMTAGPLNIHSWPGLIFAYFLFLTPYAYLTISSGLQSLDPALEEASRSSGASAFTTFRRVTLPSLRPSLAASVLLIATMGFALFSIPLVIGTPAGIDVLPVEIVHMVAHEYPSNKAGALGLSAVVVAVVALCWMLQRRLVRSGGHATISGRGARSAALQLGRWRWPVRISMLGFMALTAVLPLLGLIAVSLQKYWTANFSFSSLTLSNYESLFDNELVWGGLQNSVVLAAVGATAAIVAGALITMVVESRRSKVTQTLDGIVKIPATLTHIIIAVAFVVAFAGAPFYLVGTYAILMLAYVVLYIPQATFYSSAAYHQVGRQLTEASATSGAAAWTTFRRVLLPLMAPGLIAGWSLLFVLITGDITASSMLAGTHTPVVGFVILDLWTSGTYPRLAALGVLMTVVASTVVLTVMWLRDKLRLVL
ncbi:iron ABC transporter permease [Rhodococcus sp. WS4]|nr:iron ABC transporter permease [Rhodococcus sp. WS4]